MENQEAYEKAKKRVEAKIGFYIRLAVYVGVNVLLMIINLSTFRIPLVQVAFIGMGDRSILPWHVDFRLLREKIERRQREDDQRRDEERIAMKEGPCEPKYMPGNAFFAKIVPPL